MFRIRRDDRLGSTARLEIFLLSTVMAAVLLGLMGHPAIVVAQEEVLRTEYGNYDWFGADIALVGDFNGDGQDDIIVGAPEYSDSTGRAEVFYGGTSQSSMHLYGEVSSDEFGASVAGAGDINNDGYDDIIVGARYHDGPGGIDAGRAYIFLGGADPDNIPDMIIDGEDGDDNLGRDVSGIGRFNSDEYDDIVIGVSGSDESAAVSNAGAAYILFGGDSPDNVVDVRVLGEASYDNLGTAVAGPGDLNGDGWDDVAVGAPYHDLDPGPFPFLEGRVYIIFGGDSPNGIPDEHLDGPSHTEGQFGNYITSAGDINGDGSPDLLVGYPDLMNGFQARLVLGGSVLGNELYLYDPRTDSNSTFGSTMSNIGDVNNDGFGDFAISAWSDEYQYDSIVYFYLGSVETDATADFEFASTNPDDSYGLGLAPAGNQGDVIIGVPGGLGNKGYIQVWTLGLTQTPDSPTEGSVLEASHDQIVLTWSDTSYNEQGFYIYRSDDADTEGDLIHTTGPDVVSYPDQGLGSTTEYFYRIHSYNQFSRSDGYTDCSATTQLSVWTDIALGDIADDGNNTAVACGDYDGDGDDDLYLVKEMNDQPNVLVENNGDGTYTECTPPLLADTNTGADASWGDFDNDGDLDLFLGNLLGPNRLFENIGPGDTCWEFQEIENENINSIAQTADVEWVDYDHDGRIEVYISNIDGENQLLVSRYGFSAIQPDGLDFTEPSSGMGWCDYDLDSFPDLYLLTGGAEHHLFKQGPYHSFNRLDMEAPISGQGCSWADYDNDGDFDLFITFWGQYNVLLENIGDSVFEEVSCEALATHFLGQAAVWGDYDNDGYLDLYVANHTDPNQLFHNEAGTGQFTLFDDPELRGAFDSIGAVWSDVDDDGDLDLYLSNNNWVNKLYRNDITNENHWLKIRLNGYPDGGQSNRAALGATISVEANGQTMWRFVSGTSGYASQGPLVQHFGLGTATEADLITVYWPYTYGNGEHHTSQLENVVGNQTLVIEEPQILDFTGPPSGDVPPVEASAGGICSLTANLSANTDSVVVHYRLGQEIDFITTGMTNLGGGNWSHDISIGQEAAAGIQYYVSAYSLTDTTRLPEGAPESRLAWVEISDNDIPACSLQQRVHAMCGLPAVANSLDTGNLFADLGAYGSPRWRYWTTPYATGGGTYTEYGDGAAEPAPGRGFWIVAGDARDLVFAGRSTPLDQVFRIPLDPGWTLMANPFGFELPVDWINPPTAVDPAYHVYDTGLQDYVLADTLQIGAGCFVWLAGDQPDTLDIDIIGRGGAGKGPATVPRFAEPDWRVAISAWAAERGDGGCVLGQREDATDDKDRCDFMKPPPPPGLYVHLSLLSDQGLRLMRDWRGRSADGQTWTLLLTSNLVGENSEIEFAPEGPLPEGWSLMAIDDAGLETTDLLSTGVLTTRIHTSNFVSSWHIAAGPQDYIEGVRRDVEETFASGVTRLSLAPATPNPFRSTVGALLSLTLPADTRGTVVVYDVRGRPVRTLHAGELAQGVRRLVWHGDDDAGRRVAAGVYFVRVATPGDRLVSKVTLLR